MGAAQTNSPRALPLGRTTRKGNSSFPVSRNIKKRTILDPKDFNRWNRRTGANALILGVVNGHYTTRSNVFHVLDVHSLQPRSRQGGQPGSSTNSMYARFKAREPRDVPGLWEYNANIFGLHGCTAVIVVSQKAVWLSHIFEGPSIVSKADNKLTSDYDLKNKVIGDILHGDGTNELQALKPMTMENGDFGPGTHPEVIIITPVDGPHENYLFSGVYDDKVQQIMDALNEIMPPGQDRRSIHKYDRPR